MTNREFQQTKRILLGQERMNKKYAQLAHYIQERFSVQVINVTCSKRNDSINVTLCFKYENEENFFYTSFPQLFYPLMTRQFFCDFHEKSEDFCVS